MRELKVGDRVRVYAALAVHGYTAKVSGVLKDGIVCVVRDGKDDRDWLAVHPKQVRLLKPRAKPADFTLEVCSCGHWNRLGGQIHPMAFQSVLRCSGTVRQVTVREVRKPNGTAP